VRVADSPFLGLLVCWLLGELLAGDTGKIEVAAETMI
jgi:hypothetical protein